MLGKPLVIRVKFFIMTNDDQKHHRVVVEMSKEQFEAFQMICQPDTAISCLDSMAYMAEKYRHDEPEAETLDWYFYFMRTLLSANRPNEEYRIIN